MAFWFAELGVRDRVASATNFFKSHNRMNMFHTKYDESRQITVNLNDYNYS
jgi:hypothetical protein